VVRGRPREWLNQLVPDALMLALAVVVGNELGDRATKMPLPSTIARSVGTPS
jgi:hypothetical protein